MKKQNTKYISLEQHHKIISDIKKQKEIFEIQTVFLDDACVTGMGNVVLKDDSYKFVNVSIKLLKRLINCVEQIHYSDNLKDKRDTITLGICKEYPLLIGEVNPSKKLFSGVILAPREPKK